MHFIITAGSHGRTRAGLDLTQKCQHAGSASDSTTTFTASGTANPTNSPQCHGLCLVARGERHPDGPARRHCHGRHRSQEQVPAKGKGFTTPPSATLRQGHTSYKGLSTSEGPTRLPGRVHYEVGGPRTPPAGPATSRVPHYRHQQQALAASRAPEASSPPGGHGRREGSARGSARPGDPARVSAEERECRSASRAPEPRPQELPRARSGLRLATTSSTTNPLMADGPHERSGTRIELPAVMQGREAARA